MVRIHLLALGVLLSALVGRLSAVDAGDGAVTVDFLPEEIASDVRSVIRINNPAWLIRQSSTLSTSIGIPDAISRGFVAEYLFGAADLSGLDLHRPAILAWRSGREPFLAILPIADRQKFLRSFGLVFRIDRLLVQVGERDGTVVYSHNTAKGLDEYRLLFRDGYAYLGRDVAEVRAMADKPLPPGVNDGPPLEILTAGRAVNSLLMRPILENPGTRALLGLSPDGSLASWRDVLAQAGGLQDLASQVSQIHLTLQPKDDEVAHLRVQVAAIADTSLAMWAGRQANRSNRLLPMVERPGDLVRVHGTVRWNGEMESIGRTVAGYLLKGEAENLEPLRERLTPEVERELRAFFRMRDDSEAFAAALGVRVHMDDPESGHFRLYPVVRMVADQPRAADYLNQLDSLDALFRPDHAGTSGAVAGLLAYQGEDPRRGRYVIMADRNKLVSVQALEEVALENTAQEMVQAVSEIHNPSGTAGLLVVRLQVDEVARQLAIANRRSVDIVDPLAIELVVKADGKLGLVADMDLPVQGLGRALGQAGLLQVLHWRRRLEAGDDSAWNKGDGGPDFSDPDEE